MACPLVRIGGHN